MQNSSPTLSEHPWPGLAQGARIAVVSPGGTPDGSRLASAIDVVTSWGYELVVAPHALAKHRYTAGTATERTEDLLWALTDPSIHAVWFSRGGFGTIQTLRNLPWDALDGRPVLGFSDATALLLPLVSRGKLAIHGPVLQTLCEMPTAGSSMFSVDDESRQVMRTLLATGESPSLPGYHLCGPSTAVSGRVIGGNLAVLASMCGTEWALSAQDKIVFLEEINENPYRLDRLLCQMILSGCLEGAKAVVLGDFTGCDPVDRVFSVQDLLRDLLEPLNIPIIAGLPCGHAPKNFAWRLGQVANLTQGGLSWAS